MKKFVAILLCFLCFASPVALADDATFISYEEFFLNGLSYDVPSALCASSISDETLNFHPLSEGQYIGVTYQPVDDLSAFITSDTVFCDLCLIAYNAVYADDPAVGLPLLFDPTEGLLYAALITTEKGELHYFTTDGNALISIDTVGYSSSVDLQLAFMQMISSLSCTSSEE